VSKPSMESWFWLTYVVLNARSFAAISLNPCRKIRNTV
jgi:hypothetical protein